MRVPKEIAEKADEYERGLMNQENKLKLREAYS